LLPSSPSSGFFSWGFPTKMWNVFLISLYILQADIISHDLIFVITDVQIVKLFLLNSFIPSLHHLSCSYIFQWVLCSETPTISLLPWSKRQHFTPV
jgi:hypothetical protein